MGTGAVLGLLLAGVVAVGAIQVFDCEDEGVKIEALDLHAPAKCPDPESDYKEEERIRIQLLQTSSERRVTGYRCDIKITRRVTKCGFNSITYGHTTPVWNKAVYVTNEECRNAVKNGRITVEKKDYPVKAGQPY